MGEPPAVKCGWALSLVLGVFALSACGGGGGHDTHAVSIAAGARGLRAGRPSEPTSVAGSVLSDGDSDNPRDPDGSPDIDHTDPDEDTYTPESYLYPDRDDKATLAFGRSPGRAQRRAIADVVRRYFTAAGALDGSAACPLLLPSLAKSIAADYGSAGGPAYLQGAKTCPALMAALFGHYRSQFAVQPKLLSVRLRDKHGQVVLGSRVMHASEVALQLQRGAWYLQAPLGQPLP